MSENLEYKLDHVGIRVFDLDKSIDFYKNNFNFKEIRKADKPDLKLKLAKLQLGDSYLELLQPYEKQIQETNIYQTKTTENLALLLRETRSHIAINTNNIILTYNRLIKNKVEFAISFNLKSDSFFCYDPDKNLIEVKENK